MKAPQFQIFKGKNNEYFFHLMAKNSQIILQSEGYKKKRSAVDAIKSIKKNASEAEIVDL